MTAEGTTGTGGTDGYNYEHPETAGETDDDLSPNWSGNQKVVLEVVVAWVVIISKKQVLIKTINNVHTKDLIFNLKYNI